MIRSNHRIFAVVFAGLLPLCALAQAPVVDDSENFAILDEQQADMEQQPVAKAQLEDNYPEEEIALAQDNESSTRPNSNVALLDKLQGMKQEIQELRGQLELQAHELTQLKQQQLAFYKDLDARLGNSNVASATSPKPVSTVNPPIANDANLSLAQTATTTSPVTANTSTTAPALATIAPTSRNNPADEQLSYLSAYDLVKTKHFDEALLAMQNFVKAYPQGGYSANAHYWLGELFMVKKNYTQAIDHFDIVLKQFPSSSKAAACTLKIGYALAASGKMGEAKQRLQQVLQNYPDTPTAQLAMAKLHSLNSSAT